MNVAIIGRGTSSIVQACIFLQHGHHVTIYYDPDVPTLSVGEGTTPHVDELLTQTIGISFKRLDLADIVSVKKAAKFVNWGKGKTFFHDLSGFGSYPNTNFAYHLDTLEYNNFVHPILEAHGVTYIPERVTSIQETEDAVVVNGTPYDFLVHCSGWTDGDEYMKPVFTTLNAAFLRPVNYAEHETDVTTHEATEDGWQFHIPFPKKGQVRKGYLFNTDYISPEQVKEKLGEEGRVVTWTPKQCKFLFRSRRQAYNGNKLCFVEPLHAYSFVMYIYFAELMCEYLDGERSRSSVFDMNSVYRRVMLEYQTEVAFHYQYGSVFKTPFWINIQDSAEKMTRHHHSASKECIQDIIDSGYPNPKPFIDKVQYGGDHAIRIFGHTFYELLYIHQQMNHEI